MKKILAKIWWFSIVFSVMFGISCADSEKYWWVWFIIVPCFLGFLTANTYSIGFPESDYEPEETWEEIENYVIENNEK